MELPLVTDDWAVQAFTQGLNERSSIASRQLKQNLIEYPAVTCADVHNRYQSKIRVVDDQLGTTSGSVYPNRIILSYSFLYYCHLENKSFLGRGSAYILGKQIALSRTYEENSPQALMTIGLLNASSAGLQIYMALVDLLAADFMCDKLQGRRIGHGHGHHHHGSFSTKVGVDGTKLLRYRVIAMVLELGIIVHSIVIGLSLGASNNTRTIKGLVAALCFHQMFEGMGLGGCILQAEYKFLKKAIMAFFFAITTPFGIALGIALSSTYEENSPRALITVGLLNASSAGLLIYMALVDLLAADFMGDKLQGSVKLQIKSYMAVLLGAGGMSLMAKWA
ncbi:fe(2+) transport protein 2-like [Nicotiana tabacum]|uniref:Fe(2+) transport protein 2-like n=1 Tax=Nicotiana tabacum TaxID=4097 RepID=A0AC58T439_TOBAC